MAEVQAGEARPRRRSGGTGWRCGAACVGGQYSAMPWPPSFAARSAPGAAPAPKSTATKVQRRRGLRAAEAGAGAAGAIGVRAHSYPKFSSVTLAPPQPTP
eukprot:scaffold1575_cov352-Prasinococcus_capsulatus_cf.AAC.12